MRTVQADEVQRALLEAQVTGPGETSLADVAERVAQVVAEAEPPNARAEWGERFSELITQGGFLPSVPTLANAGRSGQLAACFALEVDDTLESIYGNLHRAARIQQGSGGVGLELSALRPRGTPIGRSGGHTPGPVAFAELFARSAHVMAMAGRRAGAHLAVLRDDHPDIIEFIRAKRDHPDSFPQLGLAIGMSDRLLRAARNNEAWELHHPLGRTDQITARELLQEIAESILETGNPTLLFLDRIEADNPTPALGRLRVTNPCGEQPLLSGESCLLGSLQLPTFLKQDGTFDETRLGRTVQEAIRFLDNAHTINNWPDEEIARASQRTRKVGLGVMGLADLLLLRELPYDRPKARELVRRILGVIAREANAATRELGEQRGVFPAWVRGQPRRNATTRAIAPTGTLRLLAGCSPGIEPYFAPRVDLMTDAGDLTWTDAWLRDWLGQRTSDPKPVFDALAAGISFRDLPDLCDSDRLLLRQSWEIAPEDQLEMQATAQDCVDGAVSKTVQFDPQAHATPDALLRWIQQARHLRCKGAAFYCHSDKVSPSRIDLRTPCPDSCAC